MPKDKKVCFLIPEGGKNLSTHSAYLLDFINQVGKDIPVEVIVEKGEKIYPVGYSNLSNGVNLPNVQVQKFKFFPFRVKENLYLCLKAQMRGAKIFYVHYSYISLVNAKIITMLFGGTALYWNCGMMWLFGKKRFLRFLLNHVADYLVTGNETMKNGYHENFGVPKEKIKIMPNWVNTERFVVSEKDKDDLRQELNLTSSDKVVLFLHRLAPRKGSRYLPSIIKNVTEKNPQTKFLIAGSGPDAQWLKNELRENENVQFLGAWPNNKVPTLMVISTAYVMPSEEEGFPRVLVEAQASGLPYSAFDIGGTKEISPSEEYPYIKNVGDISGLVSSLNEIINFSSEQKINLSAKLINHAKNYDEPVVAKKFLELVQNLPN